MKVSQPKPGGVICELAFLLRPYCSPWRAVVRKVYRDNAAWICWIQGQGALRPRAWFRILSELSRPPPDARSPVRLSAINDPRTGLASIGFRGGEDPPVIRAEPGQIIKITYVNEMSKDSKELCVDGPCRNMTNLHFHGLHVSPNSPQDDVIAMMAMPGESLNYAVDIPLDQPPVSTGITLILMERVTNNLWMECRGLL